MVLSFVPAMTVIALDATDVMEPYFKVSFNQAGDELEFRALCDIPGGTMIGFVANETGGKDEVIHLIGDISIKTIAPGMGDVKGFHNEKFMSTIICNTLNNQIAGGVVFMNDTPEGTLLFTIAVNGTGRISILGQLYFTNSKTGDSYENVPFNVSASNAPACSEADCGTCRLGKDAAPGYILGGKDADIFDALQILSDVVGLPNVIAKCEHARTAALITVDSMEKGEPTIFDALQVLSHVVGLPSSVK